MIFNKLRKNKLANNSLYIYTEKEINTYEKFIADNFGNYDKIFHEIISPNIHLDIIIIPPTEKSNCYRLVTMGMGAHKMNVPENLRRNNSERAELVISLPPTWNINSSKEEDYWPIRCLKQVARLPIECNTWLGYGHTISLDEKNTNYASNTKFCSIILLPILDKNKKQLNLKMGNKSKINFYQLVPLYKEELEYKNNNAVDALLNLFNDSDTVIVNIDRKNYCEKTQK